MKGNTKPKCIFHIPNKIDPNWPSGSQIRPMKMLNAFKNIGYDVDIVMGYGAERKEQIKKIKSNIKNGVKYEFLYSESSTMPTLLTEKHHLPTHPFLDFGFFNFCKKHGIKIGLFYRDMYWAFPIYKEEVSFFKRISAIHMYKYDLKKYNELIDILYLATTKVSDYIPVKLDLRVEELPPGLEYENIKSFNRCKEDKNKIRIFYIGGIGGIYDITKLLKLVRDKDYVELCICCRELEWEQNKCKYESLLNDRINIVHKSGEELIQLYDNADVLSLFFEPNEYRKIAMPVKLFEYLGSTKPIIATKDTAAGEFIEKNNIGWAIDYDEKSLSELLDYIYNNQYVLKEKSDNEKKILPNNTWEARAKKVANQLS